MKALPLLLTLPLLIPGAAVAQAPDTRETVAPVLPPAAWPGSTPEQANPMGRSPREQALLDKIRSAPTGGWRRYGQCSYEWNAWKLIAGGTRTTAADCGGTAMRWIVGVNCERLMVNTFRYDTGWQGWEAPAGPDSKFRQGEDEMVAALCANVQTPAPATTGARK